MAEPKVNKRPARSLAGGEANSEEREGNSSWRRLEFLKSLAGSLVDNISAMLFFGAVISFRLTHKQINK